jgi:hypothetical protein
MKQSFYCERAIVRWTGALAVAAVCALFVASLAKANLFFWIVETGVVLPTVAVILGVRIAAGWLAFFSPERPPDTRTVRTIFLRDKWLADHLKISQPRTVLAFGASLVFLKLAMLTALGLAALCVASHAMSLGQALGLFAVGSFLLLGYQALGGTYLLLRQIYGLRRDRHA